jgi:hypothetical protein
LHNQSEALKSSALINLYVSDQQYAYARGQDDQLVVVVINNDSKAAEIEFNVSPAGLKNGDVLYDLLAGKHPVSVENVKLKVQLPARSAEIYERARRARY